MSHTIYTRHNWVLYGVFASSQGHFWFFLVYIDCNRVKENIINKEEEEEEEEEEAVMVMMATAGLNPNAPMYVPWAYRAVEDFSEKWWELVKSCPWFRDYWLQECYFQEEEEEEEEEEERDLVFFPNSDDFFYQAQKEEEEEGNGRGRGRGRGRDMVKWGSGKWRGLRGMEGCPKYVWKAPKIVNVKRVSPRLIQQPR